MATMRLLDSNILIYASQPEGLFLLPLLPSSETRLSAISIPEVLGSIGLSARDEEVFAAMFQTARVLEITPAILYRAAEPRRRKRIKLGDSIIAATALVHDLELVTRNVPDFRWIEGLRLVNPFVADAPF